MNLTRTHVCYILQPWSGVQKNVYTGSFQIRRTIRIPSDPFIGVATRGTPITGARLYTLQELYMTRAHVLTRTVDRHGSRARPTNFHRGW